MFCFSDLLAVGARRALYEAGPDVPRDVAPAGVDGSGEALYATPSLTLVPDKAAIASLAADCLAARIGGQGASAVRSPHSTEPVGGAGVHGRRTAAPARVAAVRSETSPSPPVWRP
ncbi:substrate-binding domain-containing protein [Streptomyces sp. NPDC058576]|uniref:substrate-binding domain-containing protein n=1 Tax=Streptomyces sp. NPDC058576 TaxID=3346547 RepID=UPI0036644982